MTPAPARSRVKVWFIGGASALLLFIGLTFAALGLLSGTKPGLGVTEGLINKIASSGSDSVHISGLTSLFGEIRIAKIVLSDADGVWLEARDFSAHYSITDLFFLQLNSDHITLAELTVLRAPALSAQQTSDTGSGFSLGDIGTLKAKINKISVPSISLGEPVLGKAAHLSLSGNVALDKAPVSLTGSLSLAHEDRDEGHIRAHWDFVPEDNRRRLSLDLSEPRGGLLARLLEMETLPSIAVSLEGDGPAERWQSKLSVMLDDKPTVSGQVFADLVGETQRLEAQLNGTLAPFTPQPLVPLVAGMSELSLNVTSPDGKKLSIGEARFRSALALLETTGTIDLGKSHLDLATRFELGDQDIEIALEQAEGDPVLVGFVQLSGALGGAFEDAQLDFSGSLDHLTQGQTRLDDVRIKATGSALDLVTGSGDITSELTLASLITGNERVDRLVHGPLTLTTALKVQPERLTLGNTAMSANEFRAAISGEIAAAALDLSGTFDLANLGAIDPSLEGEIRGTVMIDGTPDAPSLHVRLDEQALWASGKRIDTLKLDLESDLSRTLALSLSGRYDGAPLSAHANMITRLDGSRSLSPLAFSAPGARLEGAIAVSSDGIATGQIDANVMDLSQLGPLLLQPDLDGSIRAEIQLLAQEGKQTIEIDTSAPSLAMGALKVSGLVGTARLVDPAGAMHLGASVEAASLLGTGQNIRNLKADISGDATNMPFSVEAQVGGNAMGLNGTARQSETARFVDLQNFTGGWQGIAASLASETRVRLGDKVVLETPLQIRLDTGLVTLSGSAGDKLDLRLEANELPLSMIDKVAASGEALSGSLSGKVTVTGSSSDPRVDWTGSVSSLLARSMREAGLPPLSISSEGTMRNRALSVQNQITGGGANLSVAGSVGLESLRLDLRSSGTVPFSLAARSLSDAGLRLDGAASLDIGISGTADSPQFSGSLTTKGARFIELSSGIILQDLGGTIRLDGETARLDAITGRIGKEGQLSLTGTVGIAPGSQYPADIAVQISNGVFKYEEILTSQFNANLSLKGKLAANSALTGGINLQKTEISIPESLPQSLSPVSVRHVNAQDKVANQAKALAPRTAPSDGQTSSISLGMTIASPRRIYVRGRGMDAELGGTIRIEGTTANPRPVGSLAMSRGRMDVLTKRLDFDSGSLSFSGSLDPALAFVANTTNNSITYSFKVGGYASNPALSLSSSPEMPEDEILANLFFDRNIDQLSAFQIAQLADAVATLSGLNSGPGVMGRLRDLAGIDNIDVKSDKTTGETTVGVGRYLNDRTYVNVEKGTKGSSGKVTIDLEITNQLKARGETDSEGKSKAGIFFEQDY